MTFFDNLGYNPYNVNLDSLLGDTQDYTKYANVMSQDPMGSHLFNAGPAVQPVQPGPQQPFQYLAQPGGQQSHGGRGAAGQVDRAMGDPGFSATGASATNNPSMSFGAPTESPGFFDGIANSLTSKVGGFVDDPMGSLFAMVPSFALSMVNPVLGAMYGLRDMMGPSQFDGAFDPTGLKPGQIASAFDQHVRPSIGPGPVGVSAGQAAAARAASQKSIAGNAIGSKQSNGGGGAGPSGPDPRGGNPHR